MEWVQRLDPVAALGSILILASIGFLAQAAYALWLHATVPCLGSAEDHCRGQLHPFFGSERAEGVAALAVVALSFGVFFLWASRQIRFVLPALLRRCRAFVAGRGLRGLVAEVRGRIARAARALLRDEEAGPDAKRVQREFQKQRVQRLIEIVHRNCGPFLFFLILSNYFSFLAYLKTWQIWEDSLRESQWMLVFGAEAVPMLCIGITVLFCDLCPSRVTPLLMDVINVFLGCVWVWKLAVAHTDVYPYHQHWLTVTHLMKIYWLGNARLCVALNALIFAVDAANVFVRPNMPGNSTFVWVFYRDFLVFIGISVMSWALEQHDIAAARLLVQTQKADQTTALVEQVLSRACDAVPQLDAELRLSEPCADLGVLLLRESRIPAGSQFLDFIRPEDHGLFRQSLAGPALAPAPAPAQGGTARGADEGKVGAAAFAGLCHLRMQAANNQQIKVSVFYSCVPDPDGRPSYVLGIREDREEGAAPLAVLDEPPGPMAGRLLALAALPEDQAPVVSDDRSSSAWSSVSDGEGAEDGVLTVWADAASDDWRVLTCSPDFALLGGAGGPCRNLSEWMSEKHVLDIATIVDWQNHERRVKVVVRPPGQPEYTCKVGLGPVGAVLQGHLGEGVDPALLVFSVRKAHTQTAPAEWDATRELMAKARKKHAGGAVQQGAGAANSVRRGRGQPLPARLAESEPSAPRLGIPDSPAVSEPSARSSAVEQL